MKKDLDNFNFVHAMEHTRICLPIKKKLAANVSAKLRFYLLSQPMDAPRGVVNLRQGVMRLDRPGLLPDGQVPPMNPQQGGDVFAKKREFVEMNRGMLDILQFGCQIDRGSLHLKQVSGSMQQWIDACCKEAKLADDIAVVAGVDDLWDVSLFKLFLTIVEKNVLKVGASVMRPDRVAAQKLSREQIEEAFVRVKEHAMSVSELFKLLRQSGLFAEYEDRFFELMK